jgi:hypothetical protein
MMMIQRAPMRGPVAGAGEVLQTLGLSLVSSWAGAVVVLVSGVVVGAPCRPVIL